MDPSFTLTVVVLGGLLMAAHGVLGVFKLVRELWLDKGPHSDRNITREDFDQRMNALDDKVQNLWQRREEQVNRLEQTLIKTEEYARNNIHELRNILSSQANTLAMVQLKLTDVVQAGVAAMSLRLDKTEAALSRLGNTMSKLMGEIHSMRDELDTDDGDGSK